MCAPPCFWNIGSEIRPRRCVIFSVIRNFQKYLDPLKTATAFLGTHAGYLLSVLKRGRSMLHHSVHPGSSRGGPYYPRADEGQTGVPALRDTIHQVSCMQLAGRRPSAVRLRWEAISTTTYCRRGTSASTEKAKANEPSHTPRRKTMNTIPGTCLVVTGATV